MNDVADSKFLSLILRHHPERVGITLDSHGWVAVDTLLAALAPHAPHLDRARLDYLVANSDKQRFAYNSDRTRIRANQGHSLPVELGLTPETPPARLYHGTVQRFLPAILAQGLQKQTRHHVHLSPDLPTAIKVGARRGRPIILAIDTAAMHAAGHNFYHTPNNVWLTDHVPPRYLQVTTANPEHLEDED